MHSSGQELNQGDVILTNHPAAGGSHLPDLTVITPVCYNKGTLKCTYCGSVLPTSTTDHPLWPTTYYNIQWCMLLHIVGHSEKHS